jgi:predicted permease
MSENLLSMNENDYMLAWGAYLVAALGCLLVWFRLTSWMWRYLREPLRVLVLVLLFSPTIVDPGKEQFAPSITITAMDLLLHVGSNAWRAVADLSMYGMIVFALYLLFVAVRWPVERWWQGRKGPTSVADHEPTLRERMRDEQDYGDTRYDARGDRRLRVEPRL